MEINRLKRYPLLLMIIETVLVTGSMIVAEGLIKPAAAEESISISCYKDARSPWSLGNVVVYEVFEAAQACNSLYYDCKGRCVGCYQDLDYVDNVCVDVAGRMFLK